VASGTRVTALDTLIALFNQRSMDLPDGVFTRQTQFVLNGIPFEERLGRSPADPLVLMLARGPAGYRFLTKAVQHAVPDASVQRGEFREEPDHEDSVLAGQLWLSGHYRGTGDPVELLAEIRIRSRAGSVSHVAATVAEQDVALMRDARNRP
jgi:hypothetical protein